MRRSIKQTMFFWLLIAVMQFVVVFAARPVYAAGQDLPYASNNLKNYLIKNSSIASSANGYVRVFYMEDSIYAENYNDKFELTGRVKIRKELDIYGGFFSGSDAYYLVFGQNNTAEDNSAEVVRVVKYDKNWKRLGAAALKGDSAFGHEIRYPFDYGNVSMAECDGILYIVTAHEGYVDPAYNQGHQGFLMFAVDEATMKGRIADADLWHSFSQHIAIKDSNNIYVLEESEGSRQTQITRKTSEDLSGTTIPVLTYGGSRTSAWAIPTYASADAIACSSDCVLAVGTSIDQSRYEDDTYTKSYNIYLSVTPMDNFSSEATRLKWITNDNAQSGYRDIKLTKVTDNRFLLSWETAEEETSLASAQDHESMSGHVLHYLFLNGHGEIISKEYKKAAALSECEPIVKNGKVVFYSSDGASVGFYTIDPDTGDLAKKVYTSAGKNASWSFVGGVLTISGSGGIYPDLSENGFEKIGKGIKKLIIKDGITTIGKNAFSCLENLKEVSLGSSITEIGEGAFSYCGSLQGIRLPRGVRKIGTRAFYGNSSFRSIYIPKSVSSIGERVFETGYYWVGNGEPVIYTTIYCEDGSAAQKYAKKEGIEYIVPSVTLKDRKANGTGKPIAASKASLTGTTGKVSYVYYTDKSCKKKTTPSANGSSEKGAAPTVPGTYYVKAVAAADDVFEKIISNTAKLVITSTAKAPFRTADLTKSILQKNQYVKDTKTKATYKITMVTKKKGAVSGGTVTYIAPTNKKLTSVKIGKTVKLAGITFQIIGIGKRAFYECTGLKKATIGANISSIGEGAFGRCKKLKKVIFETSKLNANSVGKNAFYRTPSNIVVTVPKKNLSEYKKWLVKRGISKKAKIK